MTEAIPTPAQLARASQAHCACTACVAHGLKGGRPAAGALGGADAVLEAAERRRSLSGGCAQPTSALRRWRTSTGPGPAASTAAPSRLMTLDFRATPATWCWSAPMAGKTMRACNLGYQTVLAGHTALFITAATCWASWRAGQRLRAAAEAAPIRRAGPARHRRGGYLSYSNRHADPLSRVGQPVTSNKSTVVTTNRAFAEWAAVFQRGLRVC